MSDIGYPFTAGWTGEVLTRFEPGNFRTASEWPDHCATAFLSCVGCWSICVGYVVCLVPYGHYLTFIRPILTVGLCVGSVSISVGSVLNCVSYVRSLVGSVPICFCYLPINVDSIPMWVLYLYVWVL